MAVNPIETQKYLKGVDYPANRDSLIAAAKSNDAPQEILDALQAMELDSFDTPAEVMSGMKDGGQLSDGGA